jgi:hypothetical protein
MKRNMGTADRTIRFVVAILLATLYLTGVASGSLGVTLMVIVEKPVKLTRVIRRKLTTFSGAN